MKTYLSSKCHLKIHLSFLHHQLNSNTQLEEEVILLKTYLSTEFNVIFIISFKIKNQIKTIGFALWAVSQNTQFEEEVILSKLYLSSKCHLQDNKTTRQKDTKYKKMPREQIGFALWAVSQNTQFEEEVTLSKTYLSSKCHLHLNFLHHQLIDNQVLLYPFTSLLAEFGGSLGLFCGFSFLTIWDGLKKVPSWMRRSIQRF